MNKVTYTQDISYIGQPACKNGSESHSACSEGGRTGFPDLVKGGVGAPFMQLLSHLFLQFWSESVSQLGPLDLMPKLSPVRSSAAHISEVKLTLLRSFVRPLRSFDGRRFKSAISFYEARRGRHADKGGCVISTEIFFNSLSSWRARVVNVDSKLYIIGVTLLSQIYDT